MDIQKQSCNNQDNLIAESIFVSEFHDKVGNAIVYCYPEYLPLYFKLFGHRFYILCKNRRKQDELKKDFDQIQDFVIPKDELCGKLIIMQFIQLLIIDERLNVSFYFQRIQARLLCSWLTYSSQKQRKDFKFNKIIEIYKYVLLLLNSYFLSLLYKYFEELLLNYSIHYSKRIIFNFNFQQQIIEFTYQQEKIYSREKYIFNICIMVRKEQYLSRKFWYQEITRKLAFFFTSLEIETHFIYMNHKQVISEKIKNLYYSLNQDKECFLEYNEEQYVFIKYIDSVKPQGVDENIIEIKDYLVPIPLFSSKALDGVLEQFDSELYRIYKEVNGEKCVKKISRDLNKDITKLKICLKNLYFHNMIKFVDIFRLSNHYQVTSKIHDFMQNQQLQQTCIKYILVNPEKKIDPSEVIFLYLQLQKQKSVQDIVLENRQRFEKINLVQFIQFGVINEFIERVYLYILTNREIDLFNEKNISYLSSKEELKLQKKPSHMKQNFHQDLIKVKNNEFKDFVRKNAPLDQILVDFQISEEEFKIIQDISNIQLIYR